jgi:prolyl-tRNA synthetase
MAKQSTEGLTTKKEDNFTDWFTQLMIKAELADYTQVSGAIVYRPASFELWEKIKDECDKEFKKIGIKNSYFPLLIPEKLLTKEEDHIEGFAPEVAWVTHGGNTKLKEKLAIRPTSEAIMYDSYSKWIRSYRDLPLLLNQWNNVVRWEFNNPVPFFRGREFLWNEAHTVFETETEALVHGKKVIKAYNKVVEEFMAVPGIYGRKTEKEKFAGAVFSEKMHHILPSGRVIEGVCFHYDGQNFAKAYDIKFTSKNEKEEYVFQNTHAISTRMLGTMLGIHSDNKGVIIPPKLATNKIVIIPILFDDSKKQVLAQAKKIAEELGEFEPILDSREDISPGKKYNEWELKGIPLRIELGPRDLKENSVMVAKRTSGEKIKIKIRDLKKEIPKLLEIIQSELLKKAKKLLKDGTVEAKNKTELLKEIKNKKMVKITMCNSEKCEEQLKTDTAGTKVLFIDPKNPNVSKNKCVICNKKANYSVYVGKTY